MAKPPKVLDQIRALDAQKAQLLEGAKAQALAAAEAAIAELRELGFNYRLVEGSPSPRSSRTSGGRRSGIREEVLGAIAAAGKVGVKPAAIRKAIGIEDGDKRGAQSVANAISALNRASKITKKGGSYIAA